MKWILQKENISIKVICFPYYYTYKFYYLWNQHIVIPTGLIIHVYSTNCATYVTVIIAWCRYSTPWHIQLFLVVELLGDPIIGKISCYIAAFSFFWAMWQSSGIYLPPLYHDFPSHTKNTIWFSKLQTLTTPDSIKLNNLKIHTRMQRKGKESPQHSWIFRIYASDFWADTGVHTPTCESGIG
jgi:hypothetical protein